MDEEWRNAFLPEKTEDYSMLPPEGFEPVIEQTDFSGDGLPEPFVEDEIKEPIDEEAILSMEKLVANLLEEGPESQLAVVLDNQQRLMMAIDQMASGFSNQLVILARRIDNFERVLDQSIGQPTMTNLMFDAPEVFNKVVSRKEESETSGSDEQSKVNPEEPAVQPRTPKKGYEIPDEVEHLLNYQADFPVAVEVQAAFYMWKQKHSTFQEFVKVAGGPVAAKKARTHLE